MAEEWREVALTATACLMIAGTSEDALEFLDAAISKLSARVEVLRRLGMGHMFSAEEISQADRDPDGVSAAALLEDALNEIADTSDNHVAAGRLFDLFREHLAGEQGHGDQALEQACEAHRAATLAHADQALTSLLSALSFAVAAEDAFDMAQGLPSASPLQDSWTSAAEAIARDAHQEAVRAQAQIQKMRHAILLEFFDVEMIVKKAEKEQWMALARTMPGTLLLVDSSGLMAHVESLSLALHGLLGAGERAGLHYVPSDSDQRSSSTRASVELLEAAHVEATRLMVLHSEDRRIFPLCAPHLGVHGTELLAWDRHQTDTSSAAQDSLFKMRSLGSVLKALDCVADCTKAERRQAAVARLLGRAVEHLGHLRAAVERMGRFVVIERNHVQTVLDG